ncbi:ABC transporter permease [Kangiella sediminilitoris]|uniref:ABC transporter permease n=1 Tax=Kangiella sediminilitoris TaxID=1144748 RepID=UPI00083D7DF3|nr:ABC transporter permease [Kangiella sediminilitoris]
MTLPDIGYLELIITCVPVILVGLIFYSWKANSLELVVATLRMIGQLIAIGFVLVYLFKETATWLGLTVMAVMLTAAGWIAMRPLSDKSIFHIGHLALALLVGCGFMLAIVIFLVLDLSPWYQPRYVIPLAGMLLANTMNSLSLSGERFETEVKAEHSFEHARNKAFHTAMIPQINGLLAVGLVALPGMMTGQILSGVSPLIAVRYQIVIMVAILCSSAFSTAWYLQGRYRRELKSTSGCYSAE